MTNALHTTFCSYHPFAPDLMNLETQCSARSASMEPACKARSRRPSPSSSAYASTTFRGASRPSAVYALGPPGACDRGGSRCSADSSANVSKIPSCGMKANSITRSCQGLIPCCVLHAFDCHTCILYWRVCEAHLYILGHGWLQEQCQAARKEGVAVRGGGKVSSPHLHMYCKQVSNR